MILLVFFILGWRLLINKAVPPAVAQPLTQPIEEPAPVRPVITVPKPIIATPPPPPIPEEIAPPHRGRIAMRIPEPIEVKSPGGRPCVYVAMPPGVQRKRTSYPCVVEDGIKPAGLFRSLEA
jgi:hypothetical protein